MSVMVRGLKKIYGDHVAVVDLHLSVQPKEIYGLLGPDGAGKTTALRCLAGVMMPSAGQIKIAGQDVTQDPERGRLVVGYLPQQFSLYGDLTVEENLQFLAQVRGLTGAQSAARIDQMLQFVRLSEHRKKLAAELSGGMKQKLALCAALLHEPSVIILDEPTAGVDPFSRREDHPRVGSRIRHYTYTRILSEREVQEHYQSGRPAPYEGFEVYNEYALRKYGLWRLVSTGPDGIYLQPEFLPNWVVMVDLPYDPSNGLVSVGNILRTQKHPDGVITTK